MIRVNKLADLADGETIAIRPKGTEQIISAWFCSAEVIGGVEFITYREFNGRVDTVRPVAGLEIYKDEP